jgi:hypothetical protein
MATQIHGRDIQPQLTLQHYFQYVYYYFMGSFFLLISWTVSQNWHTMFDERKWAMVPKELVREEILGRLIEIKNEGSVKDASGEISA